MNEAWLKSHWYYVAGALIGLFVVYEILKSAGASASGTTAATDLSGGGQQIQALTSAAAIQDAQTNAQTTVAAYAASVQSNQIAATLQLGEVQTAAELAATQQKTQAAEDVSIHTSDNQVATQAIITQGQVLQTQIEGQTIDTLGAQSTSVKLAQVAAVKEQVDNLARYSKHFGTDIGKLTPALLAETGQGSSAPGVQAAVSGQAIAVGTPAVISASTSLGSKILQGLFA